MKSYIIINRDEELIPPDDPFYGNDCGDNNGLFYHQIGGWGPAFINLLLADKKLCCLKDWHQKYTRYCIGDKSLATPEYSEKREFKGFEGKKYDLIAID